MRPGGDLDYGRGPADAPRGGRSASTGDSGAGFDYSANFIRSGGHFGCEFGETFSEFAKPPLVFVVLGVDVQKLERDITHSPVHTGHLGEQFSITLMHPAPPERALEHEASPGSQRARGARSRGRCAPGSDAPATS